MIIKILARMSLCLTLVWGAIPAKADEGMWLFSDPPRKHIKAKYGLDLTDSWLEHLQKACVRLGGGGSGAFVSADGLILTNHHVGMPRFSHIPGQSRKLVQDGFYATSRDREVKCPGLEVSILWDSEDVTERVHHAIKPGMSYAEANRARRAVCCAIEKESLEATGLACEVEALYHGAKYRVMRYRTYTDVRLVFCPEYMAGSFLDCCFFRAYEKNQPAKIEHYLRLPDNEPASGDMVFITGFPMSSNRFAQETYLEARYGGPLAQKIKWLGRTSDAINRFSKESTESAWEAWSEQVSMKDAESRLVYLIGTPLESALSIRRAQQQAFRAILEKNPKELDRYLKAEKQLTQALKETEALESAYFFLESGHAFNSYLFGYARHLVRLAEETAKPNAERLPEYTEARLRYDKLQLLAQREIGKNLEKAKLLESLEMFAAWAGESDDLVNRILNGKTFEEQARRLVHESRLDDPSVRKKLLEGGKKALDESKDPMIELAILVDGPARKIRLGFDENVREPLRQAYAVIESLRMQLQGPETYPDATGSLRLSYGRLQQNEGRMSQVSNILAVYASLYGNNRGGEVPTRWAAAQHRLDGTIQIWLESSCDAVPGNSGSPVLDRSGRLIGLAARNAGTTNGITYQAATSVNYALAVPGMLVLLETVYDAAGLVKEMGGKTGKKFLAQNTQDTNQPAPSLQTQPAYPVKSGNQWLDKRYKTLVPALIKALKDSDKEVVQNVTQALGNVGAGAIPSLVQVLESPDKTLRMRAAAALGKMGPAGEEAMPALLQALQDGEVEVRREAAGAIALILQVPSGEKVPNFQIPRTTPVATPVNKSLRESWIGQIILPAKAKRDIQLRDVTDAAGSFSYSYAIPMVVLDEREDALRINDGQHEGWVAKEEFVLLRNAPAYFSEILKANPKDAWALFMRGAAWRSLNVFDRAIIDCDESIQLDPTNAGAFEIRGAAFGVKLAFAKAMRDLDQAIKLDPKHSNYYSTRGGLFYFQREYDKAIADADRAIGLAPRNNQAYRLRGVSWQAKKDYVKAMRDIDEAIRLNPKNRTYYYDKACCFAVQGQADDAIEYLRQSIEFGYHDFAHIASDSDLDSIRDDPRYKDLLKKYTR